MVVLEIRDGVGKLSRGNVAEGCADARRVGSERAWSSLKRRSSEKVTVEC